jgi:hypothetical protein
MKGHTRDNRETHQALPKIMDETKGGDNQRGRSRHLGATVGSRVIPEMRFMTQAVESLRKRKLRTRGRSKGSEQEQRGRYAGDTTHT